MSFTLIFNQDLIKGSTSNSIITCSGVNLSRFISFLLFSSFERISTKISLVIESSSNSSSRIYSLYMISLPPVASNSDCKLFVLNFMFSDLVNNSLFCFIVCSSSSSSYIFFTSNGYMKSSTLSIFRSFFLRI